MSNEKALQTAEDNKDAKNIALVTGPIQDTLEKFMEAASVEAVYGKPVQNGDTIVIPAAEVLSGMGFGLGTGYDRSPGQEESQEQEKLSIGGGGGGGGRVFSRPVAIIVVTPHGVEVEPVVDVTKIALAMFTTAGFVASMLLRMRTGKKLPK